MATLRISQDVFQTHASKHQLGFEVANACGQLIDFVTDLATAANLGEDAPYSVFALRLMELADDNPTKGLMDFSIIHARKDYKDIPPEPATASDAAPQENGRSATPQPAAETGTATHAFSSQNPANSPLAPSTETSGLDSAPVMRAAEPNNGARPTLGGANVPAPAKSAVPKRVVATVDTDILDFSFGVAKLQDHTLAPVFHLRADTTLTQQGGKPAYVRHPKPDQTLHIDELQRAANFLFSWFHEKMPEKDRPVFEQKCAEMGLVGHKQSIGFHADMNNHPALQSHH